MKYIALFILTLCLVSVLSLSVHAGPIFQTDTGEWFHVPAPWQSKKNQNKDFYTLIHTAPLGQLLVKYENIAQLPFNEKRS